jgi:16S rRNA (cytosine1402-N4)-methyltransferase
MLEEAISGLQLAPGKAVVDATCGTGGHSEKILEAIIPGGKLIAVDRDEESLAVCRDRLKSYAGACLFAHSNFAQLGDILKGQGIKKIDAILFDLGVSSFQLEDPQRGFSFQREGPLDMRLDRSSYISAYDLLNNLNEEEISSLLWNFGQERWHNRIARFLVEERERHPIATTSQLAGIVARSIPGRYRRGYYRIHPATRTFQAVRIAVNRELENLESALNAAVGLLHKQGRICVISFHSLEDRIVKWGFRRLAAAGEVEIITAKPLTPLPSEAEANPLSRSAKMRVAEKR